MSNHHESTSPPESESDRQRYIASKEASAEIHRLIAFLDASDDYVMTELQPSIDGDEPEQKDEHDEPSLGSLVWMVDQSKSWTSRQPMAAQQDWEHDDCDREDDDPDEDEFQPVRML